MGRFIIPLPTRVLMSDMYFSGSRSIVLKRFESLKRKLQTNNDLRTTYYAFMSEYLLLEHVSVATSPGRYVIPYYALCSLGDSALKIRMVFDASVVTRDCISLDSCLPQGLKLQQDIVDDVPDSQVRVHQ